MTTTRRRRTRRTRLDGGLVVPHLLVLLALVLLLSLGNYGDGASNPARTVLDRGALVKQLLQKHRSVRGNPFGICFEVPPAKSTGNKFWLYLYCHEKVVLQFPSSTPPEAVAALTESIANWESEEAWLTDAAFQSFMKNYTYSLGRFNAGRAPTMNYHRQRGRLPALLHYYDLDGTPCPHIGTGVRRQTRVFLAACRCDDLPSVSTYFTEDSAAELETCSYTLEICVPQLFCETITSYSDVASGNETRSDDDANRSDATAGVVGEEEKTNLAPPSIAPTSFPHQRKMETLDEIRRMFYHGYDSYMHVAFPRDEIKPMTCEGADVKLTAGRMLTLIDSLDTLAVLGNKTEFQRAIELVSREEMQLFDKDDTVSVFETTIRILGGLLSAHLLAVDKELGLGSPSYDGSLLRMAVDIADRLLPAFETGTGLPYGTVHLRNGVPRGETTEACTAAAGSLSLEFGLLSVLTGESVYGAKARGALRALYELRSPLNLIGRHLDVQSGKWTEAVAGIGSNIDSAYEYYLKQYVLFGDEEAWDWFVTLYAGGVKRHLRLGRFYQEVEMKTGVVLRRQFAALQAFWPGLQVLAGDVGEATRTLNAFLAVAGECNDLPPEDFDLVRWATLKGGTHPAYLLRPELVESIYYARRATADESWLHAGADLVKALRLLKVKCGYASAGDVGNGRLLDAMPSFFLAEVAKYLYLLFDDDNFLNRGNWIYTTEAHPFRVTMKTQHENHFVPALSPTHPRATKNELECPLESTGVEPNYRTLTPRPPDGSFRPFPSEATADLLERLQQENQNQAANAEAASVRTVTGELPGLGKFRITAEKDSFIVEREETRETLVISGMDSRVAVVESSLSRYPLPIYVALEPEGGPTLGASCKGEIVWGDTCDNPLDFSNCELDESGTELETRLKVLFWGSGTAEEMYSHFGERRAAFECGITDGFGGPHPEEFLQTRSHTVCFPEAGEGTAIEDASFPVFPLEPRTGCVPASLQEEELTHVGNLSSSCELERRHVFALARRGECSFETKARVARAQKATALLVSLLEDNDRPFVMAASKEQVLGEFDPVTTYLVERWVGHELETMLNGSRASAASVRLTIGRHEHVHARADTWIGIHLDGSQWTAVIHRDEATKPWILTLNAK